MKKKFLMTLAALVLIVCLSAIVLAGCDDKEKDEAIEINVIVPDGSPAIALAKMINDNDAPEGYKINYRIVEGATNIGTSIAQGSADVAIAPTNLLSTIYNNTGSGKLVGTIVQGALYMVGKTALPGDTTAEKLASLKGKVVYNIGQGATPDLTFKYILEHFDIEYANTAEPASDQIGLQYVNSGSELIPLLKQGKAQFGVLGEPAVSNANSNAQTQTVLDIQELWKEVTESQNAGFPQAGLYVVNKYLSGEHWPLIDWIKEKMVEAGSWAVGNPSLVSQIMVENGSASLNGLTAEKIAGCNISWISATDSKKSMNQYLGALYLFDPKTIGGRLPDDGFYYVG